MNDAQDFPSFDSPLWTGDKDEADFLREEEALAEVLAWERADLRDW